MTGMSYFCCFFLHEAELSRDVKVKHDELQPRLNMWKIKSNNMYRIKDRGPDVPFRSTKHLDLSI